MIPDNNKISLYMYTVSYDIYIYIPSYNILGLVAQKQIFTEVTSAEGYAYVQVSLPI